MLQGVIERSQKCQTVSAPNFLQGAISASRQRHFSRAPTSFIWCRDHLAEMPLLKRTKGRASIMSQKYQRVDALPNQLQGTLT